MYTAESINRIREVDISTIVGHYTQVNTHGKACCPIHNEKTPSLSIKKSKNIFKCFGCGAGGDAIKFVMLADKVTFAQALETIAQIANLPLEREEKYTPEQQEAFRQRQEVKKTQIQLLMEALAQYQALLWKDDEVMRYLTDTRGMDENTIRSWGLGYAPAGGRFLCNQYSNAGLLPTANAVGLVRDKESRHYDVYQNRIIFPIHNYKSELVTLAGRIINKEDTKYGKYINGYDSALYNKSQTLYALDRAERAIKQHGCALLVEGYTDVISMHRAGAEHTVASCGTAFTDDMAKLLKRHTNHVILMRDADAAGQAAAVKDIKILLAHQFRVDVLSLPNGQDPDDFAKQYFPAHSPELQTETA
jgi:DNA primase catalytic core